jgi:hypothetical protein
VTTLAFVCGAVLGVTLGLLIARAEDIWWVRKMEARDDGTADRGD